MKNRLFFSILLIGFFAQAQTNFYIENINKNTRGITKMNFFQDDAGEFKVQIYAKCSPNDCDWGSFAIMKDENFNEYLKRENDPYVITNRL